MPTKKATFEQSIETLEQLVERMEKGGLPLEDALKDFESGITLVKECQKSLNDAEQKVEILIKQNGAENLEPFDQND